MGSVTVRAYFFRTCSTDRVTLPLNPACTLGGGPSDCPKSDVARVNNYIFELINSALET